MFLNYWREEKRARSLKIEKKKNKNFIRETCDTNESKSS